MTDLPFMPLYVQDFEGDPRVQSLDFETQNFYLRLLVRMWGNGGWLPANEKLLARMLGCDVRRFRRHFAETSRLLRREVSPICGQIWMQKRVTLEWNKATELRAKNKARTAKAREEKAKKSTEQHSVTEANGAPVTGSATDKKSASVTERNPQPQPQPHINPLKDPPRKGRQREREKPFGLRVAEEHLRRAKALREREREERKDDHQ